MHTVITGGTGFLGQALARSLLDDGHEVSVYTRAVDKCRRLFGNRVSPFSSWHEAPEQADAVVNLSGEPLVGTRWNEEKKDRIRSSRLSVTHGVLAWIDRMQLRPEVMISGSAVGYYGYSETATFTESDKPADDFSARLCRDWELAAEAVKKHDVRLCTVRTGIVLHPEGGALKQMLPAYKLGLGGPISSGRQWLSWIHREDWVNAVKYLLVSKSLHGAFNLTSPNPVKNEEFSSMLACVLHRPNMFRVPAFSLKLLFGDGADLLINGQKVMPAKLQQAGFEFSYPTLEQALRANLES
ncbi:TIGR01777 family oxidoreductase [Permianibacter aggregans]|uniref:TIGR01777 family protein n=1 Tax=Permianibacter aggregans TaxID=1510150 RepID=A0A4R6UXS1_9GAMM|nr:TIGR01777 family oxidoreductase [Permianibacter aggregans]QGX38592.1 TIGR01777 family protein [Permianibacter aggregans]TDQ50375.1 hypothetical protein EV696_10256 [Permianibacter aggregans]